MIELYDLDWVHDLARECVILIRNARSSLNVHYLDQKYKIVTENKRSWLKEYDPQLSTPNDRLLSL